MQHHRFDALVRRVMRRTWTGVVGDKSPALWHFVENIGGNHPGHLRALRADHFDALDQVVNLTGQ